MFKKVSGKPGTFLGRNNDNNNNTDNNNKGHRNCKVGHTHTS